MSIQNDGFSTTISFAATPGSAGVTFKEKAVTPPGVDGGGENDTTTMRNTDWRTKQPKKLKSLTDSSITVAWDPALYDTTEILAIVNENQLITITFPDGDTLAFWGWLNEFTPGANEEGSQPEAEITIMCSNQNDAGVEVAPVFTAA